MCSGMEEVERKYRCFHRMRNAFIFLEARSHWRTQFAKRKPRGNVRVGQVRRLNYLLLVVEYGVQSTKLTGA